MSTGRQKKFAAGLSIFSNTVIIVLKLTAGLISGSISIISEAIHSLTDFLGSVLTFFAVMKSSEPADKRHPFGHGKYEDMSGFIEGGLIIFAALFIIYEALKKIFTADAEIVDTTLGLYVMGFAFAANIVVSSFLFKTAKATDSVSLYADAQHIRSDVWSSLGVFAGLFLIKLTGIYLLDSVIAIFVAAIIFKTGFSVAKTTMDNLLDCSLPDDDLEKINSILGLFVNREISGFKNLKARRLGPQKKIEVTLIFPNNMTIAKCHSICDTIEKAFEQSFPNVTSSIHLEPEVSEKVLN